MVAAAIGGAAIAGVAGSAISAGAAGDAASSSANAQLAANQNTVDEQKREFDFVQNLLKPYNEAGTNALTPYGDLLGSNGAQAQQQAISQLQTSPLYQSQMQAGTTNILQNASATGGLRGGNTSLALAQLGTSTLGGAIQQKLQGYSGLISTGLGAATQTGSAATNSANAIGQANTALGQGLANTYNNLGQQQSAAYGGMTSAVTGALGTYAGLKAGGYQF